MLSLDQLPLQAEGCRHLVSLITNYGMQYVKPTIGSGVMTDIAVALSQSCVSLYAWYFSGFCQAMSAPGPPGGRPRPRRERDDADTGVSFVLRPDATESGVRDLLLRAITEARSRQTELLDADTREWGPADDAELLDAYTRDALLQVHWGPADDAEERDDAADDAADDAELLDADGRDADSNLHWDSADDAEQRDDAADDAEPQAESDDAADDARNAEPDGDDSQARDDSQATLHLMSPAPADDAELNGEPDDATDDAADDAELNGEPDDPHDFAERLIDEAHVRLIIQMKDPELAADINRAAGRDDAAQLISPLPLSYASRIRACIRGYRWREGILSRGDVTSG